MDDIWDQYIETASNLLEAKEKYQITLGRLTSEISEKYGVPKIREFSEELKEQRGLLISTSTLLNYRWVHEKIKDLNLPEDLPYVSLQYIAGSGKPEYWAKRVIDEGLSGREVYKLIRAEKGLDKKPRQVLCPNCGNVFNP